MLKVFEIVYLQGQKCIYQSKSPVNTDLVSKYEYEENPFMNKEVTDRLTDRQTQGNSIVPNGETGRGLTIMINYSI